MKETFEKGPWFVEYDLGDGARISRLSYRNIDLLSTAPNRFKHPSKDFGKYETRPVYGYDDCFPSVEKSLYPNADWNIPDHGELCWLEWEVESEPDKLTFSIKSRLIPIVFQRIMHFKEEKLVWQFNVINKGRKRLPFQHIMHPLLPLSQITDIRFPAFEKVWSEESESFEIPNSISLSDFLLKSKRGDVHMLYLQKVEKGSMSWRYSDGLSVEMNFPVDLFPTLGVWWNNSAYPNEDGCRRIECAFEPIAGRRSRLPESYEENLCQFVRPNEEESWQIPWSVLLD